MRNAVTFLSICAFCALALPLAGQDDRPNLSGTWQFDSAKSELHTVKVAGATWVIHEDDSSIQITESAAGAGSSGSAARHRRPTLLSSATCRLEMGVRSG